MANETTEELNSVVDDIKEADAGKSFEVGNHYVEPWENVDEHNYTNVRNGDEILQVLTNQNNMQFTKEQTEKYLRLLMPMYTRRVEVEDLNRNFWVIGQTISALCEYIFNKEEDKIPYNSANTIFQVIDLPRAQDKPYRDINEFVNEYETWYNTTTNTGGVRGKLRQFEKIYPNKHLAFLIRCRIGNYEKDYYHTEIYPYIAFFDANEKTRSKQWSAVKLNNYSGNHKTWPFGFTLRIDSAIQDPSGAYYPNDLYRVQNIRGRVYAVRENNDVNKPNQYYFYHNLDGMPPYEGYSHPDASGSSRPTVTPPTDASGQAYTYRAMVRIKPTITSGYGSASDDGKHIIAKVIFEIEDVARKLHWVTQLPVSWEGQEPSWIEAKEKEEDRYRDFKEYINGRFVNHNPEYNIVKMADYQTIDDPKDGLANTSKTIEIPLGEWGKSTGANPTVNGFSTNFRDSGFQGSLCDMMTYRGVSKAASSSNQG